MLFDINDFDETLPGPWEWDVKRMAASFEIMGRFRGFSPGDRYAIVTAGVREYRDRMRRAAGMGTLGAWYDQLEAGVLLNLVRDEVQVNQLDKKRPARRKSTWRRLTATTAPGCSPSGRPRSAGSCGSWLSRR